jgi:hypothetical protein
MRMFESCRPSQSGLYASTCECGSEQGGTATFRRYDSVSVCGIGPWKYHFGPLSPGAIFGVSFFTEHRGGEAPLEAIEPISPAAVSSEPAREVHQRPVYKPDTDKHSRVIAQGDLFEGASDRFPRRAAGLAQHDSDSPRLSGLHPVMCRVLRPNQSEKGSFGNHRPALRWLLPPRGLTPHQT